MTYLQALILGIVQGLTEFIPVSSSGHLVLIPKLFGWELQSTSFDITLHAGTLLALIIYFHKDLFAIIKKLNKNLTIKLIMSSIPAGLVGIIFEDFIEKNLKSTIIIATMLIVIGFLMILSNKMKSSTKINIQDLGYRNALYIGVFQAIALIRGTSRSGITILGGLFNKLSLKEATKYSFLIAIPIMIAVSVKQVLEFQKTGLENLNLSILFIGFVSSMLSGLAAIGFMMNLVEKIGLKYFGIYRIILGVLVILIL